MGANMAQRGNPNWKSGVSGNPQGRTPGTSLLGALRKKHSEDVTEIFASLIEQAKSGDIAAAGIVMSRMLPQIRPTSETVQLDLPEGTHSDQAAAVVSAIADGRISPPDGKLLLDAIQTVAQLSTLANLEERLLALESNRR
jgi:hypothetical protein